MKNTSPIWLNAFRKPRLAGGKSWMEDLRGRPAEQGRSQHDAGQHLAHDARLTDERHRPPHQPRRHQDPGDLGEEQKNVGHQERRRPS